MLSDDAFAFIEELDRWQDLPSLLEAFQGDPQIRIPFLLDRRSVTDPT